MHYIFEKESFQKQKEKDFKNCEKEIKKKQITFSSKP